MVLASGVHCRLRSRVSGFDSRSASARLVRGRRQQERLVEVEREALDFVVVRLDDVQLAERQRVHDLRRGTDRSRGWFSGTPRSTMRRSSLEHRLCLP